MNQLFQNILTASFHGSIVILVVMALRLVLKKTPKKFLCMLWLLAGLRLLMPFEIKSDLSLQPQPEPVIQQIIEREIVPVSGKLLPAAPGTEVVLPQSAAGEVPSQSVSVQSPSPAVPEHMDLQQTSISYETRSVGWTSLLPYLWIMVAFLFLVYTVVSYVRLRLLVREAIKIPGGWECDRIETAFILGFIRPRIYIPMGLSKMVRKHILAHERTHLEKGDHWYKMIGFIALALHWFNPLVWAAYILLCKDIEMACDERVVQFMELSERKEYSAALLNCSTNKAHFAACPVAFGEVSVKHRIKSVLKYKKPGFWISLAGVIAIAFVAVCLVTSPVDKKNEPIETAAEESITVDNVDDLLAAIGPDREIILKSGTYNLCEAKNYGTNTNSDYYSWSGSHDGSELVIHNVDNLTIRGNSRLTTTLETDPRWANVIRFQNSNHLTLEGFTAGHTRERGECSGGVLYLDSCTDVSMESLGLYGCGVIGVTAQLCSGITLTDSEIYECSSSAVSLSESNHIAISDCRIYEIGSEQYGGHAFFSIDNCQDVSIANCEMSDSTLTQLLCVSGTEADIRDNLFLNNRVRDSAFQIQGIQVIMDGNIFKDNSIRNWYSHYGNFTMDRSNNPILTFEQISVNTPPKNPDQAKIEVHVSTVDELIAAIGPDREIILDAAEYDLSTATGYGISKSDYFFWEDLYDGPGLVISNVDNMTIRSNDGDVKKHTISSIPRYADVLAFYACSNVTLSGFTAGHTKEPGSCAGGVIEFRDCDNMTVDNCGLYGCGILGVYAEYSSGIHVKNSEIYECSLGGIEMRGTDNITIEGNTFRDLGGEETNFIGCSNITLDGNLLSPDQPNTFYGTENNAAPADEEDLVNLGHAVTAFAEALFNGDTESMKLYLSSDYDLPIVIYEDLITVGATPAAKQDLPAEYANMMETKGYCNITLTYVTNANEYGLLSLEMCRENGIWKVQYYTIEDSEIHLLVRDIYNFTWAYFEQDLEILKSFLADSYTGSADVYLGDLDKGLININDHGVHDTVSNKELAKMNTYSVAIPFKKDVSNDSYAYLNIAFQRRENKQTFADGRTESEWVVVDYGLTGDTSSGGIEIKTIEGENYTGFAMIIDDPSRVFLGTSTDKGFSANTPGKRISEMFDRYPTALAAVNAGPFFDDGTTSNAVGSYPLGLTISEGETVWTEGTYPGMKGFVGFNTDDELVVLNRNLTQEEAEKLNIRDGVSAGPALIIDREVLPAANEDSGYNLRTAIGQTEDGKVILLCTNGRVWDNLGASYREVADQMMALGAESACLLQGGSATGMMYRADLPSVPQLYTTLSAGQTQPRRQPTYWMVAAE